MSQNNGNLNALSLQDSLGLYAAALKDKTEGNNKATTAFIEMSKKAEADNALEEKLLEQRLEKIKVAQENAAANLRVKNIFELYNTDPDSLLGNTLNLGESLRYGLERSWTNISELINDVGVSTDADGNIALGFGIRDAIIPDEAKKAYHYVKTKAREDNPALWEQNKAISDPYAREIENINKYRRDYAYSAREVDKTHNDKIGEDNNRSARLISKLTDNFAAAQDDADNGQYLGAAWEAGKGILQGAADIATDPIGVANLATENAAPIIAAYAARPLAAAAGPIAAAGIAAKGVKGAINAAKAIALRGGATALNTAAVADAFGYGIAQSNQGIDEAYKKGEFDATENAKKYAFGALSGMIERFGDMAVLGLGTPFSKNSRQALATNLMEATPGGETLYKAILSKKGLQSAEIDELLKARKNFAAAYANDAGMFTRLRDATLGEGFEEAAQSYTDNFAQGKEAPNLQEVMGGFMSGAAGGFGTNTGISAMQTAVAAPGAFKATRDAYAAARKQAEEAAARISGASTENTDFTNPENPQEDLNANRSTESDLNGLGDTNTQPDENKPLEGSFSAAREEIQKLKEEAVVTGDISKLTNYQYDEEAIKDANVPADFSERGYNTVDSLEAINNAIDARLEKLKGKDPLNLSEEDMGIIQEVKKLKDSAKNVFEESKPHIDSIQRTIVNAIEEEQQKETPESKLFNAEVLKSKIEENRKSSLAKIDELEKEGRFDTPTGVFMKRELVSQINQANDETLALFDEIEAHISSRLEADPNADSSELRQKVLNNLKKQTSGSINLENTLNEKAQPIYDEISSKVDGALNNGILAQYQQSLQNEIDTLINGDNVDPERLKSLQQQLNQSHAMVSDDVLETARESMRKKLEIANNPVISASTQINETLANLQITAEKEDTARGINFNDPNSRSSEINNLNALVSRMRTGLFNNFAQVSDAILNNPLQAINSSLENISSISTKATQSLRAILGMPEDLSPNATEAEKQASIAELRANASRISSQLSSYARAHEAKAENAKHLKKENDAALVKAITDEIEDGKPIVVKFKYLSTANTETATPTRSKIYEERTVDVKFKNFNALLDFHGKLKNSTKVELIKEAIRNDKNLKSAEFVAQYSFIPVSDQLNNLITEEAKAVKSVVAELRKLESFVGKNSLEKEQVVKFKKVVSELNKGEVATLDNFGVEIQNNALMNPADAVQKQFLSDANNLSKDATFTALDVIKALKTTKNEHLIPFINIAFNQFLSPESSTSKNYIGLKQNQIKSLVTLAQIAHTKQQINDKLPETLIGLFGDAYKKADKETRQAIESIVSNYAEQLNSHLNTKAFKQLQNLGMFSGNERVNIDKMVMDVYQHDLTTEDLMAVYAAQQATAKQEEARLTAKSIYDATGEILDLDSLEGAEAQLARGMAKSIVAQMNKSANTDVEQLYVNLHDSTQVKAAVEGSIAALRGLVQQDKKEAKKEDEKPVEPQEENKKEEEKQTPTQEEETAQNSANEAEKPKGETKGSTSYQEAFNKALIKKLPEENIDEDDEDTYDEDVAEARTKADELGLTADIALLALEGKTEKEINKELKNNEDLADLSNSERLGFVSDVLNSLGYADNDDEKAFNKWKSIIEKAIKNANKVLEKKGITPDSQAEAKPKAVEKTVENKPVEEVKPVEEKQPVETNTTEKEIKPVVKPETTTDTETKDKPEEGPKPEPEVTDKTDDSTLDDKDAPVLDSASVTIKTDDSFGESLNMNLEFNNTGDNISEATFEEINNTQTEAVINAENQVTDPINGDKTDNFGHVDNAELNLEVDLTNNAVTAKVNEALEEIKDALNTGITNSENKIGSIQESVKQTVDGLNTIIKDNDLAIQKALESQNKGLNKEDHIIENREKLTLSRFIYIGLQKFKQMTKTIKPLATFTDFISKIVKTEDGKINEKIGALTLAKKLAERQKAMLEHFVKFHDILMSKDSDVSALSGLLKMLDLGVDNIANENLSKQPEILMGNLVRLFATKDEETGKYDLPENIKTAIVYAIYTWLAENVNQPNIKNAEQINKILGRDVSTPIEADIYALFRGKGALESGSVADLGARILSILNIKFSKDTPENVRNIIKTNFGTLATYVMKEQGLAFTTSISSAELAAAKIGRHREYKRNQEQIRKLLSTIVNNSNNENDAAIAEREKAYTALNALLIRLGIVNGENSLESFYSLSTGAPKALNFLNIFGEKSIEDIEREAKANKEKLASQQSQEDQKVPFSTNHLSTIQTARKKAMLENGFSLKDTKLGQAVIHGISHFYRSTGSFLPRLFGDETLTRFPDSEVPTYTEQELSRLTSTEREALYNDNRQGYNVNPEMLGVYMLLFADKPTIEEQRFFEELAGIVHPESYKEKPEHISLAYSQEAKNEGLRREMSQFNEFVVMLLNGKSLGFLKGLASKFFMKHVSWSQKRVGIHNNAINPQSSKFIRFMTQRDSWTATIGLSDPTTLYIFKIGVLEALGLKASQLSQFNKVMQDFIPAARILHNKLSALKGEEGVNDDLFKKETYESEAFKNAKFTKEELQTIREAVAKGGEHMHSLNGLIALGGYIDAVEGNKESFVTNLVLEVDGVTNGIILSALALGVGTMDQLSGGGLYFQNHANSYVNGDINKGEMYSDHEAWKEGLGHNDAYQRITVRMEQILEGVLTREEQEALQKSEYAKDKESRNLTGSKVPYNSTPLRDMYNAFKAIAGDFTEIVDGVLKATKAGRDINKTPSAAINFGSAIHNAIDGMFNSFVDTIYKKIAEIAAIQDVVERTKAAKAFLSHLNTLAYFKNRVNDKARGNLIRKIAEGIRKSVYAEFMAELTSEKKKTAVGTATESSVTSITNRFLSDDPNAGQAYDSIEKAYNALTAAGKEKSREGSVYRLAPLNDLSVDAVVTQVIEGLRSYNEMLEANAVKHEKKGQPQLAAYERRQKVDLEQFDLESVIKEAVLKQQPSEGLRLESEENPKMLNLVEAITYHRAMVITSKAANAAKADTRFHQLSQERKDNLTILAKNAAAHREAAYTHIVDIFTHITAGLVESNESLNKSNKILDFTNLIIDPYKDLYGNDSKENTVYKSLTISEEEKDKEKIEEESKHINILLRGFNKDELDALRFGFEELMGKTAKKAYKKEYENYFKAKNIFSTVMSYSFGLFNALFKTGYRNQIEKLIKEGKIPAVRKDDGSFVNFTDLSQEQKKELLAIIKAPLLTYLHTYFSKVDETKKTDSKGIVSDLTEEEKRLRGIFLPKAPLENDENFDSYFLNNGKGNFSSHANKTIDNVQAQGALVDHLVNNVLREVYQNNTVGIMPLTTHSIDSAISHVSFLLEREKAKEDFMVEQGREPTVEELDKITSQSLNLHDARVTGVGHIVNVAKHFNEALIKVMKSYSPLLEMVNNAHHFLSLMNETFFGNLLQEVTQDLHSEKERKEARLNFMKTLADTFFDAYKRQAEQFDDKVIKLLENKKNLTLTGAMSFMRTFFQNSVQELYQYEENRLKTLLEVGNVSQYSIKGGAYTMTEEDKAEIQKQLDDLQNKKMSALAEFESVFNLLEGDPNSKTITNLTREETKEMQEAFQKQMLNNLYKVMPKGDLAAIPAFDEYSFETRNTMKDREAKFMHAVQAIRKQIADFFATYIGGLKQATEVYSTPSTTIYRGNKQFEIAYISTHNKTSPISLYTAINGFINSFKSSLSGNAGKGIINIMRRAVKHIKANGQAQYVAYRSAMARLANSGNALRIMRSLEFNDLMKNLKTKNTNAAVALGRIKALALKVKNLSPNMDLNALNAGSKIIQRDYAIKGFVDGNDKRDSVDYFAEEKNASIDHVFLNILFNNNYNYGAGSTALDIGDIYKKVFPKGKATTYKKQLAELRRSGIYELNQELYESLHKFMALQQAALGLAELGLKKGDTAALQTIEQALAEDKDIDEEVAATEKAGFNQRLTLQLAYGLRELGDIIASMPKIKEVGKDGNVTYKRSKDFVILAESKGNSQLFTSKVNGMTALSSLASDLADVMEKEFNTAEKMPHFSSLELTKQLELIEKVLNKISTDMEGKIYSGSYLQDLNMETQQALQEAESRRLVNIRERVSQVLNENSNNASFKLLEPVTQKLLEGRSAILFMLDNLRQLLNTNTGLKSSSFTKDTDINQVNKVLDALVAYIEEKSKDGNIPMMLPKIEELFPNEHEAIQKYQEIAGNEERTLTAEEVDFKQKAGIYNRIIETLGKRIDDIKASNSNTFYTKILDTFLKLFPDAPKGIFNRMLSKIGILKFNMSEDAREALTNKHKTASMSAFLALVGMSVFNDAIINNTLTFNRLISGLKTVSKPENISKAVAQFENANIREAVTNDLRYFANDPENKKALETIEAIQGMFGEEGLEKLKDVPITIVTYENLSKLPANLPERILLNSGAMYHIDENGEGRIYMLSPEFGDKAQFSLVTLAHEYVHHHTAAAINYAIHLDQSGKELSDTEKKLIQSRNILQAAADIIISNKNVAAAIFQAIHSNEQLKHLAIGLRENPQYKKSNFSQLSNEDKSLITNALGFLNNQIAAYGVQLTAASFTLALQHINFEDLLRELAHIQSSDKINLHEFASIFATSPNLRNFIELTVGSGNLLLEAGKAKNNPTAKKLAELVHPSRFMIGARSIHQPKVVAGFFRKIGETIAYYASAVKEFFTNNVTEEGKENTAAQANAIANNERQAVAVGSLVERLYIELGNIIAFNSTAPVIDAKNTSDTYFGMVETPKDLETMQQEIYAHHNSGENAEQLQKIQKELLNPLINLGQQTKQNITEFSDTFLEELNKGENTSNTHVNAITKQTPLFMETFSDPQSKYIAEQLAVIIPHIFSPVNLQDRQNPEVFELYSQLEKMRLDLVNYLNKKTEEESFNLFGGKLSKEELLNLMTPQNKDPHDIAALTRFLILNLANKEFNDYIADYNAAISAEMLKSEAILSKVKAAFNAVLHYGFNVVNIEKSKKNDIQANLKDMLLQFAQVVESRNKIINANNYYGSTYNAVERLNTVLAKNKKYTLSHLFKQFIKANSALIKNIGKLGYLSLKSPQKIRDFFMHFNDLRNKMYNEKSGLINTVMNELRGFDDFFVRLIRLNKAMEGTRKDIITLTEKIALRGFIDAKKVALLEDPAKQRKLDKLNSRAEELDDILNTYTKIFNDEDKRVIGYFGLQHDITALLSSKEKALPEEERNALLKVRFKAVKSTPKKAIEMAFQAIEDLPEETFSADVKAAYINQIKALGFYKITGIAKVPILHLNMLNLSNLMNTPLEKKATEAILKLTPEQHKDLMEKMETALATYSFAYPRIHKKNVNAPATKFSMVKAANRVLVMDSMLNSKEFENKNINIASGLFNLKMLHTNEVNNHIEMSGTKGTYNTAINHTRELLDPYYKYEVVDASVRADYEKLGYVFIKNAPKDPSDYIKEQKVVMVLSDTAYQSMTTGALSYTHTHPFGYGGFYINDKNQNSKEQQFFYTLRLSTQNGAKNGVEALYEDDSIGYAIPTFDAEGKIISYRYTLDNFTKEKYLKQDTRFDRNIGMLAGNIYDKAATIKNNRTIFNSLKTYYDYYKEKFPNSYEEHFIHVGVDVKTDPQLHHLWNMLPHQTKREAETIFNAKSIPVPKHVAHIIFGYRNRSITEIINKPEEERSLLQETIVKALEITTYVLALTSGKSKRIAKLESTIRLANNVQKRGNVWQEYIKEAKDTIIVKTATVSFNNILANLSSLLIHNIPFRHIIADTRHAYTLVKEYQDTRKSLYIAKTLLKMSTNDKEKIELQNAINTYQNLIKNNPIEPLISFGLLPSIVEDTDTAENEFAIKTKFLKYLDKNTRFIPQIIKDILNQVYIGKSTKIYDVLKDYAQMGDFTARYVMFNHLISRPENRLSKEEALRHVSDLFISYDTPMHATLQYADDMGITWFTKYLLRINAPLIKMMYERPLGVAAANLLAATGFVNQSHLVTNSILPVHLQNNLVNFDPAVGLEALKQSLIIDATGF